MKQKMKSTCIYMRSQVHLRLKIAAVNKKITIGSLIEQLLNEKYPLDDQQRLSLDLADCS